MACIVLSLEAVKSVNSESIDIFGPKNQEEKPKEMTRTEVSAKGWRHVTSSALLRSFNSFPVSRTFRQEKRSFLMAKIERGHTFELPNF